MDFQLFIISAFQLLPQTRFSFLAFQLLIRKGDSRGAGSSTDGLTVEPSDYISYVIVSLESKANLSELVEAVAAGEEVLIAVRGQPKAQLLAAPNSPMEG